MCCLEPKRLHTKRRAPTNSLPPKQHVLTTRRPKDTTHVAAIEMAGKARSWVSVGYDIERGSEMNFLSDLGLHHALQLCRRAKWFCLHHWGTVCSSFVWISQSQCKRSRLSPMGDSSCPATYMGNLMVCRRAAIARVLLSKRGPMVLEQPRSSVMILHERLQQAPYDTLERFTTWTGALGAPTPKLSQLFTTTPTP